MRVRLWLQWGSRLCLGSARPPRACAAGCGWGRLRHCGWLDGPRVGEKPRGAAGPGKAVTGRKDTLAKVTVAGCSGDGGSAERVESRHSLKGEPAGFEDHGSRGMGKGQSQSTSWDVGAPMFCEGGGSRRWCTFHLWQDGRSGAIAGEVGRKPSEGGAWRLGTLLFTCSER